MEIERFRRGGVSRRIPALLSRLGPLNPLPPGPSEDGGNASEVRRGLPGAEDGRPWFRLVWAKLDLSYGRGVGSPMLAGTFPFSPSSSSRNAEIEGASDALLLDDDIGRAQSRAEEGVSPSLYPFDQTNFVSGSDSAVAATGGTAGTDRSVVNGRTAVEPLRVARPDCS